MGTLARRGDEGRGGGQMSNVKGQGSRVKGQE